MRQSGITLLELMVVLAVAAILLSLAVPALTGVVGSGRLASASNMLVASLHLTRSEAIKRNARAVMCPSANGAACADGGGWHQGWLVFHDANNNAALDGGESVILSQEALSPDVRLTGNQPVARYISYSPSGAAQLVSGAFQAGTLTVCLRSPEPAAARQIILSSTGRPRVAKTTLASCP
jgi:type IV fimbrial biogenesis protein FimT